ncbi:MAG TPA: hypothetical protein VGJ51_15945 [Candidatus Angelobacter sp.]
MPIAPDTDKSCSDILEVVKAWNYAYFMGHLLFQAGALHLAARRPTLWEGAASLQRILI